jgi:lactate permease
MMLALQAAPLLLLVALLLSGRATPIAASTAALLATLPAVFATLPGGSPALPFLAHEAARGAFLALMPIGVVAGGLMFHAAVQRDSAAREAPATPRRILVTAVLAGMFLESVTGFAVGAVFALSALRGMGMRGAPAGAIALLALTLVPWGGLGPGTALGAALIGLPAQDIAAATAPPNAIWIVLLAPVFWRLCAAAGVAVPTGEKIAQLAALAVVGALLIASHAPFAFEVAGIVATGPVLLFLLWRLDPPRDAAAWRAALAQLAPYLGLTVALLLARAWHEAPAWRPFGDLPAFPMTHVAVVLWLVAGALLPLRADPLAAARGALARAKRPAIAMLLYVILARWMAGSGIAASLAQAMADGMGPLAPYAVPVLGLASGMITGSNVGSNAALMPVQSALGGAAGLPPLMAPALHNFSGAAGAGMSFAVTALVCALLNDGTRPAQLWRLLAPSLGAVLLIGWVSVWLR